MVTQKLPKADPSLFSVGMVLEAWCCRNVPFVDVKSFLSLFYYFNNTVLALFYFLNVFNSKLAKKDLL